MKQLIRAVLLLGLMVAARASLEISSSSEDISERGRVERAEVRSPLGRFGFIPPAGWRMESGSAENTLVLCSDKLGAAFTLVFHLSAVPHTEKELRAFCSQMWPEVTGLEAGICATREKQSPVVEFTSAPQGFLYRTRVGFVSFGEGGVEFRVSSPDGDFSRSHRVWTTVLNSFAALP